MSVTIKDSVIVELYENTLTDRKDDRVGRVVTTKSLTEDDLIAKAVARRSDISPSTMRAVMEVLTEVALQEVANGASVKFGLAYFNLGVTGVFIGDNAKWESAKHTLWVKAAPTSAVREAIANCTVDVRGMAVVGTILNSLVDVATGEENTRLTPGGGVNLVGSKIKIDGDSAENGIRLINQNTNEVVLIPRTSILVNDPSRVTFIVPTDLQAGDYKMSITTQFSLANKPTKEPRVYIHDYILTVIR